MTAINEDQLISTVKQIFVNTKSKFCRVDQIERLLLETGLTSKEAKQAISLARARRIIRACYPYRDEIRGDYCYELLTKEDREFDRELDEELLKKR